MKIAVLQEAFDPWGALQAHQAELQARGRCGALAVFVGSLRDINEGATVQGMELQHYPGMTEKYLQRLAEQAHREWDLLDSLVLHRVGALAPGDPIVLVAVWSSHRAEAFAACRFLIDELKSTAPFWKKETLPEGTRWVESNTPG